MNAAPREFILAHLNEVMPLGQTLLLADILFPLTRMLHTVQRADLMSVMAVERDKGTLIAKPGKSGDVFWTRVGNIAPPEKPKPRPGVKVIHKPENVTPNSTCYPRLIPISVPAAPWELAE